MLHTSRLNITTWLHSMKKNYPQYDQYIQLESICDFMHGSLYILYWQPEQK